MIYTRQEIKAALHKNKLAPNKRLGQNFLVSSQIVEAILARACPDPDDTIIELGVGLGSMTIPLAAMVKNVIGIEIDAGLVRWHREHKDLPENVTLLHEDLLQSDFRRLAMENGGRLKIIANLPYSISNPLLFKLLEHKDIMDYAVLMLQKEVADRLSAAASTKEYGVLSVLIGSCAAVQPLMKIGPEQFHPRPKVDSRVVRITFRPLPEQIEQLPVYDMKLLKALVKGAFGQRRKTLLNALAATGIKNLNKDDIRRVLAVAGLAESKRPDQLTVPEYVNLCRCYGDE
ncbi:MAG: ribosomal RNA small subunit methyltransferase A [Deltaproteobacteria bacterium]|nr:ribosomal RNA small subunit methyltransferase A [Deltaproteobacteria bacterium]